MILLNHYVFINFTIYVDSAEVGKAKSHKQPSWMERNVPNLFMSAKLCLMAKFKKKWESVLNHIKKNLFNKEKYENLRNFQVIDWIYVGST